MDILVRKTGDGRLLSSDTKIMPVDCKGLKKLLTTLKKLPPDRRISFSALKLDA